MLTLDEIVKFLPLDRVVSKAQGIERITKLAGCSMNQNVKKWLSTSVLSIGLLLSAGCSLMSPTNEYTSSVVRTMFDQGENIMATGYAVISVQMNDNPAQQRLLSIRASKLDAYRSLLEQVYGQYLDVNTTVGEMVVQSDTFRARVQGVIYGAQLVSITPVGEDTYTVTLSLDRAIVNDLRALYIEQMSRKAAAKAPEATSPKIASAASVSNPRGPRTLL